MWASAAKERIAPIADVKGPNRVKMVGSSIGRPRSGSALLLLFIFQAAYNFDLWLRSPIVYDIAPMEEEIIGIRAQLS